MVMAKDGEVAHSFQPLMGVSRSFFWGLMEAKWPIRRSRPSVDVVICDIGLHLCSDVSRAVLEMARVCRTGGYVAVCDDIAPKDLDAAAYAHAWHRRHRSRDTWVYAQSEWRDLIQLAGLRPEVEEMVRQPIPFASLSGLSGMGPEAIDVLCQELFHAPPSVRDFLHPRIEAGERYFDRVQGFWLSRKASATVQDKKSK